MAYLILADYKKQIQTDNLAQIIGGDYTQVTATEQRARQEIISYLTQKYLMSQEFTDTALWSQASAKYAMNRFYLDATAYSITATYALNALVLQGSNVYICTTAVTVAEAFNINKWTLLGAQYAMFYITTPNPDWNYYTSYLKNDIVFWNNKNYTALQDNSASQPDTNPQQWGSGVAYSVTNTILPTNTTYYTAGDNRNQQILGAMIDIVLYHLHSRISPHNIPALRFDRYKDIMAWLKNIARGDDYTVDLPKIQPNQGMRNVYGSTQTKANNNI